MPAQSTFDRKDLGESLVAAKWPEHEVQKWAKTRNLIFRQRRLNLVVLGVPKSPLNGDFPNDRGTN